MAFIINLNVVSKDLDGNPRKGRIVEVPDHMVAYCMKQEPPVFGETGANAGVQTKGFRVCTPDEIKAHKAEVAILEDRVRKAAAEETLRESPQTIALAEAISRSVEARSKAKDTLGKKKPKADETEE